MMPRQYSLRIKPESGFTLVEILTVIAIIGIVVVQAVPMVSTWLDKNRLDGIARRITNDLHYCRQHAISENKYYVVDFTGSDPITYSVKSGDVLGTYPTTIKSETLDDSKKFVTFTNSSDPVFNYRGMSITTTTLVITNVNGSTRTITINLGGKISTAKS